MNEDKMKNLEAMKEFFERDMKIKETLMNLAPTEADDYDELSRIEYVDKLEKGLDSLEYDTLASIKKFDFGEELNNTIKEYFENKKKLMAIGKYEAGICQKIYNSEFANMNENFVEEVKNDFVGYTMLSNQSKLSKFVKKAETVNELLHSIHSSIVNDNLILESMPQIGTKINTIEEPITLYGEENEVAEKIFKEFPLEMDCGSTDIVSLKNKDLISLMYYNYFANDKEKNEIIKIWNENDEKFQEKSNEIYDIEKIFKSRKKNYIKSELPTVVKKNWIEKIIEKVKRFFNK